MKVEKQFHQDKRTILIDNVNINKIIVTNQVPFGEKGSKYFIGYKDYRKVKPLCIILPKMSAYKRDFDKTKYVFFDKT